ncbi:MAG TPA: hypothetical protein VJ743_14695 [Albitalea sp.]|nr:hypothetical protein [Albitalea sp.]
MVIATAIAFAISLSLLALVIGFASPWIALLLMFDFMGLAKVAEPIFVLSMPAALESVRPWEGSSSLYRRLGVHRFGKLLRNSPLRHLNAGVYASSPARDLLSLYRQVGSVEATHFWAAVLFMPYIGFLYVDGKASVATFFLFIQLLFNVYPVLHLRAVRRRLDEILTRQSSRSERSLAPATA